NIHAEQRQAPELRQLVGWKALFVVARRRPRRQDARRVVARRAHDQLLLLGELEVHGDSVPFTTRPRGSSSTMVLARSAAQLAHLSLGGGPKPIDKMRPPGPT